MKVAVFSSKSYDEVSFDALRSQYPSLELSYFRVHLNAKTAALARGFEGVAPFVSDLLDENVLRQLKEGGTRFLSLRSAGYNNIDVAAAHAMGFRIARVPAYSPHAVAEHAVALMLTLNRKIHKAYNRVREGNFALEGLLGFDMAGKSVGIVGTGHIGAIAAKIMQGFECEVLAFDPCPSEELSRSGVKYLGLDELISRADILSLHCPLTPETQHMIHGDRLKLSRRGFMLINTGRGALIDTNAVIAALKTGQVGALGLDVYEEEGDLFFEDLSNEIIQDDVFTRLLTFPNVVITGHQGFFTREALEQIARVTLSNLADYASGRACKNEIG